MNMIPLSEHTKQHVRALFIPNEVATVERLLVERCGVEVFPDPHATPISLERIRFAVLRLSGGSMVRLHEALDLAVLDFRDVLVGARFGDLVAHRSWRPLPLGIAGVAWSQGLPVEGTSLRAGDLVTIEQGIHTGKSATVLELLALDPEPRYRARLASSALIDLWQSTVRHAG